MHWPLISLRTCSRHCELYLLKQDVMWVWGARLGRDPTVVRLCAGRVGIGLIVYTSLMDHPQLWEHCHALAAHALLTRSLQIAMGL